MIYLSFICKYGKIPVNSCKTDIRIPFGYLIVYGFRIRMITAAAYSIQDYFALSGIASFNHAVLLIIIINNDYTANNRICKYGITQSKKEFNRPKTKQYAWELPKHSFRDRDER